MAWNPDKKLEIITSVAAWKAAQPIIAASTYLAVDTESTGLGRFETAVGIGIAVSEDQAYYIPVSVYTLARGLYSPWTASAWEEVKSGLIEAFTTSKRLVTHNGTFDAKMLLNTIGINIVPYIHADTQLLHHTCISEEPPHGLKPLAAKFVDPEASATQDDLKVSVAENGGQWLKENKEMYKGDYKILGRYCMYDCMYTYALFSLFYPEIEKQGLEKLWEDEVLPLMQVTFELNTTGLRVNIEYFEKLKIQMQDRIQALEDEICASLDDKLAAYSYKKVRDEVVISKRSELGKYLLSKGVDLEKIDTETAGERALAEMETGIPRPAAKTLIMDWYKAKNGLTRVINLDSNADKGFIIFDVLGYPCTKMTGTGKRQVTASTLEEMDAIKKNPILDLMLERSAEVKLLSTYVEPILKYNINGRIYPSFNQTGTITGRYSCAEPMNFQTLPREDLRIKAGFIPDPGYLFVNADYSSLEPRAFSFVSQESAIKAVYKDNLDLYSQVAIQVLGLTGVSARESDANYLKKVNPDARQMAKVITLAFAYGMSEYKAAKMLKIDVAAALKLKQKYFAAFPKLTQYHEKQGFMIKKYGHVTNLVGRRRRAKLIPVLVKAGISTAPNSVFRNWNKMEHVVQSLGYVEAKKVSSALNNELNNSYNFPIQSLAASVCNAAMIDLKIKLVEEGLDAKLTLNVHDEISLLARIDHAPRAAELLQECMEFNRVTKLIDVPMSAKPIITDKSLAEAK